MTAQVRQLRQPHTCIVVPVPEDEELFGCTNYQPRCTESDCYVGPYVPSPRRAREIGLEHTRKHLGVWRPAW